MRSPHAVIAAVASLATVAPVMAEPEQQKNVFSPGNDRTKRTLKTLAAFLMPGWLILVTRYARFHRRLPNIVRPRRLSEKVLCRLLFDKRDILTRISDKAEARNYVAARAGSDVLTTMYYLTDKPETIPFDDLPYRFVVKPTHGCGWIRVVTRKAEIDRSALIEQCRDWLRRDYSKESHEAVYHRIRPRIMIEEFVDDGTGKLPVDYKFFVFRGRVEFIEAMLDRETDMRVGLFTPKWEPMHVRSLVSRPPLKVPRWLTDKLPPPNHLGRMVKIAEAIGAEWEFIRIDLYATHSHVYFGEMTLSPAGACERFEPAAYDRYLGDLWQ